MLNSDNLTRQHVLSLLPKFFIYLVVGFIIAQFASSFVYLYYFGEDMTIMKKMVDEPEKYLHLSRPMLLMNAMFSLFMFLIIPLRFASKTNFPIQYNAGKNPMLQISSGINIIMMMFLALPFISFLMETNLKFGWDSEWIVNTEEQYKAMTMVMTSFKSPLELIQGLVFIALLAGAGEEFLFRGIMQPMFQKIAKNDHIGIITTAFIFSAIHMQFLSFLPRFILGIVLGYLYHYSKNLWMPIIGHVANNAIALIMVYSFGYETENIPVESLESNPAWAVIISITAIVGTIFYQKKIWQANLQVKHV